MNLIKFVFLFLFTSSILYAHEKSDKEVAESLALMTTVCENPIRNTGEKESGLASCESNVDVNTHLSFSAETVKGYGRVFAVGDFNKDGYDDLAVGAPESDGRKGKVFTFKGTRNGLLKFWQTIDQRGLGENESNDQFGFSLASGDFNGDGYADLAVGLPGEAPARDPRAGYVMLFKGTKTKLSPWQGVSQKGLGENESGDQFGASLAAGDFNGDGVADLAVGLPGEAPPNSPKSGYVMLFKGIRGSNMKPWQGIGQGGLGRTEAGDQFGKSLAAGDFNGDGIMDLAVGLPGESPAKAPKSGYVMTFKGTKGKMKPWQGIGQGGLGEPEAGDQFGAALAAGDFNGDGITDLAVGLPGEAPPNSPRSGYVMTFKGTRGNMKPWQGIGQGSLGRTEAGDQFGAALTAGDFNGDGIMDLAVGLPGESPANAPKSGYVMTFKGTKGKMKPWQGISQDGLGENEAGDQFGISLISGDFNNDRRMDLIIGADKERPGNSPNRSGYAYGFKGSSNKLNPAQGVKP